MGGGGRCVISSKIKTGIFLYNLYNYAIYNCNHEDIIDEGYYLRFK